MSCIKNIIPYQLNVSEVKVPHAFVSTDAFMCKKHF